MNIGENSWPFFCDSPRRCMTGSNQRSLVALTEATREGGPRDSPPDQGTEELQAFLHYVFFKNKGYRLMNFFKVDEKGLNRRQGGKKSLGDAFKHQKPFSHWWTSLFFEQSLVKGPHIHSVTFKDDWQLWSEVYVWFLREYITSWFRSLWAVVFCKCQAEDIICSAQPLPSVSSVVAPGPRHYPFVWLTNRRDEES